MIDAQEYLELARLVAYESAKLSASAFYLTADDSVRLRTFGGLAGVTLALETRLIGPDGRLQAGEERHTPSATRVETTTLHNVGDGFLLSASVRAIAGAPRRGQVFAILDLVRGTSGAVQPLAMLLQGYVTDSSRLGWPGSPVQASADGPGVLRSLTGTNPAAGAEISETVPTNARWRLLCAQFTLTTDANVANREVAFVFDDGASTFHTTPMNYLHTAGVPIAYAVGIGGPVVVASSIVGRSQPIPALTLPSGARFRTTTANRQVGDDYSAPQYLVEEWIED